MVVLIVLKEVWKDVFEVKGNVSMGRVEKEILYSIWDCILIVYY